MSTVNVRHFGLKKKKNHGHFCKPIFTSLNNCFLVITCTEIQSLQLKSLSEEPLKKPVLLKKVAMAGKVDNFVGGGPTLFSRISAA